MGILQLILAELYPLIWLLRCKQSGLFIIWLLNVTLNHFSKDHDIGARFVSKVWAWLTLEQSPYIIRWIMPRCWHWLFVSPSNGPCEDIKFLRRREQMNSPRTWHLVHNQEKQTNKQTKRKVDASIRTLQKNHRFMLAH